MERFLKSRYRIGEQISENPFSVTYLGSFLASNKPLVIKIYKRAALNSSLINQMKMKVKELTHLKYHGIARLVDGDYGWQGFYYVREYVEGKSLAELLKSGGGLGLERTQTLIEEVCRALEAAHVHGIVHGGIKPNNIFLDNQGVVKVTDFVIEGQIKEAMPQKAQAIIENGRYLSPEELTGRPAACSSDLYALGLVLLETMVAGAPVSGRGLAGGLARLRQFPPPRQPGLEQLPRYLQEIIARALQKDPVRRFSSAREFRESLEKKVVIARKPAQEEYQIIFDNTVTQYGGDENSRAAVELAVEPPPVKIRWSLEKHRNWILTVVLALALLSGLVYAFFFGR